MLKAAPRARFVLANWHKTRDFFVGRDGSREGIAGDGTNIENLDIFFKQTEPALNARTAFKKLPSVGKGVLGDVDDTEQFGTHVIT